MLIFINDMIGKRISLEVESFETIESVKNKIKEKTGMPVNKQKLIFAGMLLDNDKTFTYYNINKEQNLNFCLFENK